MPTTPQSLAWPGRRAVLLVHGIGDASRADYAPLAALVQEALGDSAEETAIYTLAYDGVNDWFMERTRLATRLSRLRSVIRRRTLAETEDALATTIAEYAGDVVWPILSLHARAAVREAYIAQLKQIVQDGVSSGVPARRQRLSIICHSLGCFHTYEVLHAIAGDGAHRLQPATHEVRFENVVFVASPVQLIRTVARELGALVPEAAGLRCLTGETLIQPGEVRLDGATRGSVTRWISITGSFDPVGGYLLGRRAVWAYMDVADQISVVDPQSVLDISSPRELILRLRPAVGAGEAGSGGVGNPHCWEGYLRRNREELRAWLVG